MKTVSIGDYRKKMENRIENMRFLRAVRQAKNRHTMRTEHAVLHNLLYSQISPGLRERIINRKAGVNRAIKASNAPLTPCSPPSRSKPKNAEKLNIGPGTD